MTEAMELFKSMLKSKGLKATPQRVVVHEAMLHLGHACADQVAVYIKDNCDTNITVSSVYNILAQMSSVGIYAQRMSGNNKMYFDLTPHPHIHLYDKENHVFIDVDDRGLVEMVTSELKKRKFRGYKMDSIDIQIICHPSRKRRLKA